MSHLPNFLVVGAHRSGTTATFMYLRQHPQIFIPNKKECRYFADLQPNWKGPGDDFTNRSQTTSLQDYGALFDRATAQAAIGDISPDYLFYHKRSIPRIKQTLGSNTKIIINLRNPVSRCFSAFTEKVRDGFENLPFESALDAEEQRMSDGWAWYWRYKRVSYYHDAVEKFLQAFDNTKIVFFDEFTRNTGKTLADIFRFLEVDDSFQPNYALPHNASGLPRSRLFHKAVWALARPSVDPLGMVAMTKRALKACGIFDPISDLHGRVALANLVRPEMSAQTRNSLRRLFTEDVEKLARLLRCDLSSWVSPGSRA